MVILILLITYRSPILWILPIFCAAVANTMAGGVVYLLAKYADLVVNDQSQYILSILVIGAGTDYALLLVARYREELRRHEDRHEAMAFALHRAAPAILASAATVVVGLMCLAFADLNSTASLGPVLAVGVAVTFLVMVTLLPALLVIFGRWVFWPVRADVRFAGADPHRLLGSRRSAHLRFARGAIWIGTTVALLVACLGLFKLDANGLETKDTSPRRSTRSRAQQLLEDHGLADRSVTVQVVTNDAQLAEVTEAVAGVDGLGSTTDPTSLGDGRSYFEAPVRADIASDTAFQIVEETRDAVACGRRGRGPGRRRPGVLPRHQDRGAARQQGGHPARAAGRPGDPDPAAAGAHRHRSS